MVKARRARRGELDVTGTPDGVDGAQPNETHGRDEVTAPVAPWPHAAGSCAGWRRTGRERGDGRRIGDLSSLEVIQGRTHLERVEQREGRRDGRRQRRELIAGRAVVRVGRGLLPAAGGRLARGRMRRTVGVGVRVAGRLHAERSRARIGTRACNRACIGVRHHHMGEPRAAAGEHGSDEHEDGGESRHDELSGAGG